MASAITLAALAALLVVQRRHDHGRDGGRVAVSIPYFPRLLSHSAGAGLPRELRPAWFESPGDEPAPDARAVRIGARDADLTLLARQRSAVSIPAYYWHDSAAIAVVARNSAFVAAHAAELARMLDRVSRGAAAAALYRVVARQGQERGVVGSEHSKARSLARRDRTPFVVVGSWLEYARVAALRRDLAFFRRTESRAFAAGAVGLPGLSAEERAALERVRALATDDSLGARDWGGEFAGLEEALTRALTLLAN
ncbi:MAG TPA: hypothetical protein VFS08_00465 [Gemmatimonadaceae bacterium]|nr:hypothetical protein [Gemmatimonadaceae bacterium]